MNWGLPPSQSGPYTGFYRKSPGRKAGRLGAGILPRSLARCVIPDYRFWGPSLRKGRKVLCNMESCWRKREATRIPPSLFWNRVAQLCMRLGPWLDAGFQEPQLSLERYTETCGKRKHIQSFLERLVYQNKHTKKVRKVPGCLGDWHGQGPTQTTPGCS